MHFFIISQIYYIFEVQNVLYRKVIPYITRKCRKQTSEKELKLKADDESLREFRAKDKAIKDDIKVFKFKWGVQVITVYIFVVKDQGKNYKEEGEEADTTDESESKHPQFTKGRTREFLADSKRRGGRCQE